MFGRSPFASNATTPRGQPPQLHGVSTLNTPDTSNHLRMPATGLTLRQQMNAHRSLETTQLDAMSAARLRSQPGSSMAVNKFGNEYRIVNPQVPSQLNSSFERHYAENASIGMRSPMSGGKQEPVQQPKRPDIQSLTLQRQSDSVPQSDPQSPQPDDSRELRHVRFSDDAMEDMDDYGEEHDQSKARFRKLDRGSPMDQRRTGGLTAVKEQAQLDENSSRSVSEDDSYYDDEDEDEDDYYDEEEERDLAHPNFDVEQGTFKKSQEIISKRLPQIVIDKVSPSTHGRFPSQQYNSVRSEERGGEIDINYDEISEKPIHERVNKVRASLVRTEKPARQRQTLYTHFQYKGKKIQWSRKRDEQPFSWGNSDPYYQERMTQITSADFEPVEYLMKKHIPCRKYNYQIYNPNHYEAWFKLSPSGRSFTIQKVKRGYDENGFIKSKIRKFPIDEITGFVYGGMTTRFWMQRQGILDLIVDQLDSYPRNLPEELKTSKKSPFFGLPPTKFSQETHVTEPDGKKISPPPFYAWQCITIQMKKRDVNLVVRNEQNMQILLKFLIAITHSFDSNKNSIEFLKDVHFISKNESTKKMAHKIYLGYALLKMRMKMTYFACKQQMTLQELLFLAILKTYNQRLKLGLIQNPYPVVTDNLMKELKESNLVAICHDQIIKPQQDQEDQERRSLRKHPQLKESNRRIEEAVKKVPKVDFMQKILNQSLCKTDRVDNMFMKTMDPEELQYEKMTFKTKDRFSRQVKETELRFKMNKLKLVLMLGLVKGPVYIVIILEIISAEKRFFVLKMDEGEEMLVPNRLQLIANHKPLIPLSMQFYDPVYVYVKKNISEGQKATIAHILRAKATQKIDWLKELKFIQDGTVFKNLRKNDHINDWAHSFSEGVKNLFSKKTSLRHKAQPYYNRRKPIQQARVMVINDKTLTKKVVESNGDIITKGSKEAVPDFDKFLKTSKNFGDNGEVKDPAALDDYRLDINFKTNSQVVEKGSALFQKKVMYQNQLMNLKEKGKRLLKMQQLQNRSEALKYEAELVANHMKDMEKKVIQSQVKFTSQVQEADLDSELDVMLYKEIKHIEYLQEVFEENSRIFQEKQFERKRKDLKYQLSKIKLFIEKMTYLDKKIEFDQRFFSSGYADFQELISDVRKQIKLNHDIMLLKTRLETLKDLEGQTTIKDLNNDDSFQEKAAAMQSQVLSRAKTQETIMQWGSKFNDLINQYHRMQTDFGKNTGARSLVDKGNKHKGLIRKFTARSGQDGGTSSKADYRTQKSFRSNLSSQISDSEFDGEVEKLDKEKQSSAFPQHLAHTSKLFSTVGQSKVGDFMGYKGGKSGEEAEELNEKIERRKSKIKEIGSSHQKELWSSNKPKKEKKGLF